MAHLDIYLVIIYQNTKNVIIPETFYLFYSPTLAKITGSFAAKLIDGKSAEYTEARNFKRLDDFTSFHQDSRFVGLGKYNPNKH